MKQKITDFIIKRILTPTVYSIMQFVGWTSHWRLINRRQSEEIKKSGDNYIFAFWHNQLVLMPYWYKNSGVKKPLSVLISRSRDGDYVRKLIEYFRFDIVRGSSTRGGGTAIRGLMERLKNDYMVAITPDGPRGPRYKVQKGVIHLAQSSGNQIIPVALDTSWKAVLKTWDKLRIPLPMGNVYCIIGKPMNVPKDASRKELEEKGKQLEEELNRINQEVKRRVAWWKEKRQPTAGNLKLET